MEFISFLMPFLIIGGIYGTITETFLLAGWRSDVGNCISAFAIISISRWLFENLTGDAPNGEWVVLEDTFAGTVRAKQGGHWFWKRLLEHGSTIKTTLESFNFTDSYTVGTGALKITFEGSWHVKDTENAVVAFWRLDPRNSEKRISEARALIMRTLKSFVGEELLKLKHSEMISQRNEIVARAITHMNTSLDSFCTISDFKVTGASKDEKQQAYDLQKQKQEDFKECVAEGIRGLAASKYSDDESRVTDQERTQIALQALSMSGLLEKGPKLDAALLMWLGGFGLTQTMITEKWRERR